MKLNRKAKNAIGLVAFFGALYMTVAFIVNAIKKKSLWQAFLALLAAESAAGAALYLHHGNCKCKKPLAADARTKDDMEAVGESAYEEDEELFDEAGSREAALRIRHVFAAKREETAAPSLRREIPRDEEASEADFQ